ncbi:uncharacterized protein HMPREF1541_05710 [Cyphellophora europaea CBS 101466]|uniref:Zn(2)-C6 fungal-type domain-containing protein n=1 Tax=Cyphellophora europaea (strain CBS 101466) TaxID=1220924 RepID=W2RT42_CYPE1|nr:uncharacterized protein HMPREF1541_05710 [Cyphellophora europaea CBS 101466]ETN39485.1 hypothetical protein HMPREF1541_05710 [Cyphellophora europaea CBS 101466]
MSGNDDRGEQSDLGPNTPYPPGASAQYPHPQTSYAYPPNNDYPPLPDHDLGLSGQGYSQPLQHNLAAQLQDAAQSASARNGEGMRVNTNGTGLAGMAPPQPQGAPAFSPGGPRSSVDETPDSGTPGDPKSKRGKASQACDECRRKKTKCITTIDEHGVPTTCTSCAKANLDCQYSRQPLKRGPNKGYIKDLADRVQQVESLLPVYRQSFDGDMFGGSGDEPMSGRRNYSLPGGRASFSGPDFGRERLESLGAFNNPMATSTPRARDRFSIAVPPDQTVTVDTTNYYDEMDPRPAKRLKMESEKLPYLPPLSVQSSDFSKYYETIHPQFPILPDASETTLLVVMNASIDLQHAIIAAINVLPTAAPSQENGPTTTQALQSAIPDMKEMMERLGDIFEDQLVSTPNALVYVWVTSLLVIHNEYAVDMFYNAGPLASHALVRKYETVLERLRDPKQVGSLITEDKMQGLDTDMLQEMAARTRCMALLQNKLTLMASGRTNPLDKYVWVTNEDIGAAASLSESAKFMAYITKSLAWAINLQHNRVWDHPVGLDLKDAMSEQLEHTALRTHTDVTSPLFQQVEEYLKTYTARTTEQPNTLACLFPAAKLAEKLGNTPQTYSPLDIHLFSICVFTFLECLALPAGPRNDFAAPVAQSGLNSIRPLLQQRAAAAAASRSPADKVFWGTIDGKEVVKKSWMEALLTHIDICEARSFVNENTAKYGERLQDVTGNFGQLLDYGYLTVLGFYSTIVARAEMEGEVAPAA